MTSIRLLIRRWCKRSEPATESLVKGSGHISVKPETGDYGASFHQRPIGAYGSLAGPEHDYVQGAKESPGYNAIYDELTTLSQVGKYDFRNFISHCNRPLKIYPVAFEQLPGQSGKGAA